MKILLVFIDMVRVDHLNTYNPHAKECCIDKRLRELGGTLFTRCYSPGPDTPRSLACLQSGLYPYYNGCDTRIRWPKFFMKDGITTIWNHAIDHKMKVNLCCNKNESLTGFFKYEASPEILLFHSPDEFMSKGNFCEESLSFIGIPDMHTAIGDYKATEYAFRKGDEVVDIYFQKYLTKEFLSQFDYTMVFSDHGFQFESERVRLRSKLELLDDGRNQLLLLLHKRGDKIITKDNRLASITDLFATLEHLIGGTDFRQGYSLLEPPCRKITHVEDHQDFKVYPEIMVKQWRVISEDFDIRTDIRGMEIKRGKNDDKEKIENYLREYSPHYFDYLKQLEVLDFYDTLKSEEKRGQYFVGVNRDAPKKLLAIKALVKFKGKLLSLFVK